MSRDLVDQAQVLEELERQEAVRRVRMQLLDVAPADECQGCGCEIEAARRQAMPSATRCADCQADHERQRSQMRAPERNLNMAIRWGAL